MNDTSDDNKSKIKEIKRVSGVRKLKKLTADQLSKIQRLAAENKLDLEHLEALVRVVPHFAELVRHQIDGLREIAKGASETQKEAFKSVGGRLDSLYSVLEKLADRLDSDEAITETARVCLEIGRLEVERDQIKAEMNRDNNSLWRYLGTAAIAVGGVIVTALVRGKSK